MILEANDILSLEQLLLDASDSLDIPPSRLKDAIAKYAAVGSYLAENPSELAPFRPEIYPQGSLAIGTAVKPLGRDEFDIDLVCEMAIPVWVSQQTVKNLVGLRLKDSEIYRAMLEEKCRCWRLTYANAFHLDILPAKPGVGIPHSILVPDRELHAWKPSNPRGYASWFTLNALRSGHVRLDAQSVRASVEPIRPTATRARYALQRTVQILKRHRDVHFSRHKASDLAPISVIITTLAARAYEGHPDVLTTLKRLLERMPLLVERDHLGRALIPNPANPGENFAERWHSDERLEKAFHGWLQQARLDLRKLETARGIHRVAADLEPFLGQRRTKMVVAAYANRLGLLRGRGTLTSDLTTGRLAALSASYAAPVRQNTFFGD